MKIKIDILEQEKYKDIPWMGLVKISAWDSAKSCWVVVHMQHPNNKECFDKIKEIVGEYENIDSSVDLQKR